VSLLDRDDSLLVVIDAQPGFYAPEALTTDERSAAELALVVTAWLCSVAASLRIPVVLTEEDPGRNGPTDTRVLAAAPPGAERFDKRSFGLAGQPDILEAVRSTGRCTPVVVGYETDVCISQSAIGLVGHGFRVTVVEDATYAPGPMQARGLRRMRDEGVALHHAKGVYYEWVRTLEVDRATIAALPTPPFPM
jgi:nicotinamidase-related amidase